MTDDDSGPRTERESPIGTPVIRGDPAVTGDRAATAVGFDPDDPESLDRAVDVIREFAGDDAAGADNVYMLRGAAACAALVRGVGSYVDAAASVGHGVTISFIRKWARVHDLPEAIRRHVAMGHIAPSAAKHIARVEGEARFHLAWAVLDHDLTVREVRSLASAINDGAPVEDALREAGVTPGELTVRLPFDTYAELRRRASLDGVAPGDLIAAALESSDDGSDSGP